MSDPSGLKLRFVGAISALRSAAFELGQQRTFEFRDSMLNTTDRCEKECMEIFEYMESGIRALKTRCVQTEMEKREQQS